MERYNMPLQNTSAAGDRLATAADLTEPRACDAEFRTSPLDSAYWLERIEGVIERYPWPTVLLGLALGYVIARRMR